MHPKRPSLQLQAKRFESTTERASLETKAPTASSAGWAAPRPAAKPPHQDASQRDNERGEVSRHQRYAERPENRTQTSQTKEPNKTKADRVRPTLHAALVPKESAEYHRCDREEDGLDMHDSGKVEGGAEAGPKVECRGCDEDEDPAPARGHRVRCQRWVDGPSGDGTQRIREGRLMNLQPCGAFVREP